MGAAVKGIDRGVRGKRPRPRRTYESPIDKAKPWEVVWPQVAPVFDAARGVEGVEFVYVISEGEGGPLKIGKAKDPISRLRTMQTGNSRRLKLEFVVMGNFVCERLLQEMFEPFAIRSVAKRNRERTNPGTEWFRPEVRGSLAAVLPEAARRQFAYLNTPGDHHFDRLAEIIWETARDVEVPIHERDQTLLMARGAGTIARSLHRSSESSANPLRTDTRGSASNSLCPDLSLLPTVRHGGALVGRTSAMKR